MLIVLYRKKMSNRLRVFGSASKILFSGWGEAMQEIKRVQPHIPHYPLVLKQRR